MGVSAGSVPARLIRSLDDPRCPRRTLGPEPSDLLHPDGRHTMAVAENNLASLAHLISVNRIERLGVKRTGKLKPRQAILPRDALDFSHPCRATTSSRSLGRDVARS